LQVLSGFKGRDDDGDDGFASGGNFEDEDVPF
jgi:hypothetical protein